MNHSFLKITILKKTYFRDLVEEYASTDYPSCEVFQEGQVFYTDSVEEMPEGFCDWAWSNISREMASALSGDELPWVKPGHTFIACCTDGFRPVVFKIERMED